MLAIDLSLSSLCYAKRKTPPDVADRIEYAQGDILEIHTFDRSFDMIDFNGRAPSHGRPVCGMADTAYLATAERFHASGSL